MGVEFRVLGPVGAFDDADQPVRLGPRQQALLAALLLEPNQLIPRDQLIDHVWGDKPTTRPENAIHNQLTLLRKALAHIPDVAITWRGGYRLTVDEATIDLYRFRDLVREARTAPDNSAIARWDAALALWRGEPFTGIALPWFTATRTRPLAERHAAVLDRTDAMLRLGRHDQVLPALAAQVKDHPLDERVAGQFMLALHGAGRTGEALTYYDRLRHRLADDLGVDPGLPLREVHNQLLGPAPVSSPASVPRQLPAAPGSFTGRARELAALTRILDAATETPGTVVISATSGTGGIGKTWLTLHWAHQHRDRFPDGQLFVDLRGFSPEAQPMLPGAAVRSFLDALGVDASELPTTPGAQAALWRTLVADKRMLIVLDNAASTEQAVPLLPGGSTSTVLVNSRDHLSGLITAHGAQHIAVDILTDSEARDLLTTRLGAERLAAEPDAVDELLGYCGGFPLALSIVAGQALSHPDFALAAIATELRENQLAALDDGDPATSLPSVLSWSYATLTAEQARAFGLLGVAAGADISLAAAASLIDRSIQDTRVLLRALNRASLVRQDHPGRYSMHDLVRAYARDNAGAEGESALRRLVDFYLHTANAADNMIKPDRMPITLPAPVNGARPETLVNASEAMRWFADEYVNLTAAHDEVVDRGWHEPAWQLAWALAIYRERTGRLAEDLASRRAALSPAQALADPAVEAIVRQQLGSACTRVELWPRAVAGQRSPRRLSTGSVVSQGNPARATKPYTGSRL